MKSWIMKESNKEKINLFKNEKKTNFKLPKEMKDVLLLAGGTILLSEAIDTLN